MQQPAMKNIYIDGVVQGRHNCTANALELHLACINPSIWPLRLQQENLWELFKDGGGID